MSFLLVILVVAIVGYAVASRVRMPGARPEEVLLLRLGLVPGIGFGVFSAWYFVVLALHIPSPIQIAVEILIAVGAATWAFFHRESSSETSTPDSSRPGPDSRFLIAAVIAIAGVSAAYWILFTRQPLGWWDAWWIWNAHARVIHQAGVDWPAVMRGSTHPDYPALLPLTVARFWSSLHAEPAWVPALVGFAFLLGTLALLYAALGILAGANSGCVAVVLLAMRMAVPWVASSQYADWPLAYFFTASFALILLGRPTLVLAGLMAGLAAWTKNEGLLFVLVLSIAMAVFNRRALFALAPAAAPAVAICLWYKRIVHVPNDLFHGNADFLSAGLGDPRPLLVRVTDLHRLHLIISSFGHQLVQFAAILLLVVVFAAQPSPGRRWLFFRLQVRWVKALRICAATLLAMIAGYTAMYVISPWNLQLQLETSADRLFVQLWPGTVLCVIAAMMSSRSPSPASA